MEIALCTIAIVVLAFGITVAQKGLPSFGKKTIATKAVKTPEPSAEEIARARLNQKYDEIVENQLRLAIEKSKASMAGGRNRLKAA